MSRAGLRQRSSLSATVDLERTLVHDDARGVYLFTARRRPKAPTSEHIEVWARWQAQRHDPRPIVTELREGFVDRLARLRRRWSMRRAAARAALAPRLETLSS